MVLRSSVVKHCGIHLLDCKLRAWAVKVPVCISVHTPQHLGLLMQLICDSAGNHNMNRHLLQSGETTYRLVASLLPVCAAVSEAYI